MNIVSIKSRLDKLERSAAPSYPLYLRVMPGETESEVLARRDREQPGWREPGREVRFIRREFVTA